MSDAMSRKSVRTGRELKIILENLGITTRQFTEDCGVGKRTVGDWMSGKRDGEIPATVDLVLALYHLGLPRMPDGSLDLTVPPEWLIPPTRRIIRGRGRPRKGSLAEREAA